MGIVILKHFAIRTVIVCIDHLKRIHAGALKWKHEQFKTPYCVFRFSGMIIQNIIDDLLLSCKCFNRGRDRAWWAQGESITEIHELLHYTLIVKTTICTQKNWESLYLIRTLRSAFAFVSHCNISTIFFAIWVKEK